MKKARIKDGHYICRKCGKTLVAVDLYEKYGYVCGEFQCGCNETTNYKIYKPSKSITNLVITNTHGNHLTEVFCWKWNNKSKTKGNLLYGCACSHPIYFLNRLELI